MNNEYYLCDTHYISKVVIDILCTLLHLFPHTDWLRWSSAEEPESWSDLCLVWVDESESGKGVSMTLISPAGVKNGTADAQVPAE